MGYLLPIQEAYTHTYEISAGEQLTQLFPIAGVAAH